MKISNIDKNFVVTRSDSEEGVVFYDVKKPPFTTFGVTYDDEIGCYVRMPQEIAKNVSGAVHYLSKHTSGGRIRFSTNSKLISIKVIYNLEPMQHMTLLGSSGFSLCKVVGGKEISVGYFVPNFEGKNGYTSTLTVNSNGVEDYTIYFPLYNNVCNLSVGVEPNAILREGAKYKEIKPILYYGSSITQGGCANRPDNSYQAQIVKQNNVDYICLGFSGWAMCEDVMVDYLKKIDCSVFVFDYDHNAPTVEHLEKTHYKAYKTYRESNPEAPIIFLTRPDFYRWDTALERLKIVKKTYNLAKKSGDKNVYFIDGRTFFGKEYPLCTVDGVHPTDLGFYKMAKKIGKKINEILGIEI
jgi:hypothetical protein